MLENTILIPTKYHNTSVIDYVMSSKVNSEWLYTIKIFNRETWKHLREFLIPRLKWSELQIYKEYFSQIQSTKTDMWKFSFLLFKSLRNLAILSQPEIESWDLEDTFVKNLQKWEHFIRELLLEWSKVCDQYEKTCEEVEERVRENRMKIEQLTIWSNVEEISIDATLSDIYWTTTMEWQKENKDQINSIIKQNWLYRASNLLEAEVLWITRWFEVLQVEAIFPLTIDKIKKIHSISTYWLDNIKGKEWWLNYNSWVFRNKTVDLWIFKTKKWSSWSWTPPYLPPEDPEMYIELLLSIINKKRVSILTVWLFHLIYYWIHPFSNGNKRTTRILESWIIQRFFDHWHLLQWMWYYFKKDITTYMDILSKVLSWQRSVRDFLLYYLESFEKMSKESLISAEILILGSVKEYISEDRLRYYDGSDEIFFRFYKRNLWKYFTFSDIKKHIKENWLYFWSLGPSVAQKLEKHVKDWLLQEKTVEGHSYTKVYKCIIKKK